MEWLTGTVALAGVIVVLTTRPIFGLVAYLAVLLLYPDYLRISIGTIDISASRVIVGVLFLRCLADPRLTRHFHWGLLDSLVTISMVVYATTLAFTTPFGVWLENRAGYLMDTFFAYIVVRLVVVDRTALVAAVKGIGIAMIALAVIAIIDVFGLGSPYVALRQYSPYNAPAGSLYDTRLGLNRALGPFPHSIVFGVAVATLLPFVFILRREPGPWGWFWCIPAAAGLVCVLASLSSGAYLALMVAAVCLALGRVKHLAKPVFVLGIFLCLEIECASNRHFYDVLGDFFAYDNQDAWYRARLIEVGIKKLPEYWLVGNGFNDPGWGLIINDIPHTDVVNEYLVRLSIHGVFGLLAYCAVFWATLRDLARTHRNASDRWLRSAAWTSGSSVVGLISALMTVTIFGHLVNLHYVIVGFCGCLNLSGGFLINQGLSRRRGRSNGHFGM